MSGPAAEAGGPSRVYAALLVPCVIAAAIGVYLTVEVVRNWDPAREYAGLAPYVLGAYCGPGFLAALGAVLGLRPGTWRVALTGVAAAWSLTLAPMIWLGIRA